MYAQEEGLTELIWEGKYDKDGHKVAPLRVRLPFQTVETVNESVQQRQRTLDLFSSGRPAEWRNRLIWGDKKYVLPALLEEFAGQVNLIYIDPPFDTGADFSFSVQIDGEGFVKEANILEQKAYRDTWGRGLDSYLQWFYETALLLRELLASTGSIYVHINPDMSHYVKAVLDETIGKENFINQLVWRRTTAHGDAKQGAQHFGRVHDVILYYGMAGRAFEVQWAAFKDEQIQQQYNKVDEDGRRYRLVTPTAAKPGGDTRYQWHGVYPPTGRYWAYTRDKMDAFEKEGRIYFSNTGQPYIKYYLDERPGVAPSDLWTDVPPIGPTSLERVDYPTQKPEALLDRMIKASSKEGDLVLDCFVGSGTTAAVAEKLGRRWIACDLGRFAIHTTRKRLLSIPGVKPFMVQNLGKYERQLWQSAEFGEHVEQRVMAYRRFILELYSARSITGYTWLHGVRAGRMVHVGAVDSPVSPGDITQIAAEFKRAVGRGKDAPTTNGVDVLGWDFAFELNEVAKQQAAQANINMRFLRIPREVLEKKAVEQGDIRFFELAALSVDAKQKSRTVTLTLTDFVIPPDDVPEDVRQTITNWEQWIDYWAVDWNNRDDTFHNEWQDYRTREKHELQKTISHTYEQPGTYIIMVKVIDILGSEKCNQDSRSPVLHGKG